MDSPSINELALFSRPSLLITESEEEYESLSSALVDVIKPRNIIEHIYVSDVAQIAWEIARLRRCKTVIINTAYRTALKDLLSRELLIEYQTAEALAQAWFTDKEAKEQVAEILSQFHLDESAIEAESIKSLAQELETIDRMLMSLEVRRNRTIRHIADYRDRFAKRVREGSDRVIEADGVLSSIRLNSYRSDHGNREATRGEPTQRARKHGPAIPCRQSRAGQNAYRHGLSLTSSVAHAKQIERLAPKLPVTPILRPFSNMPGMPRKPRSISQE